MATLISRDRDVGVTIPVLVWGKSRVDADGFLPGTNGESKPVRLLPFSAMDAIHKGEVRTEIERAFQMCLSDNERAHLDAVQQFIQGVQTRNASLFRPLLARHAAKGALRMRSLHAAPVEGIQFHPWSKATEKFWLRVMARDLDRPPRYPLNVIGEEMSKLLADVRFVIWWVRERKCFAPGLLCDSLESGLAALISSTLTSPIGLAKCEREGCPNHFRRTKQLARFCSLKCGNAARKSKQRSRERMAKDGPRKTR